MNSHFEAMIKHCILAVLNAANTSWQIEQNKLDSINFYFKDGTWHVCSYHLINKVKEVLKPLYGPVGGAVNEVLFEMQQSGEVSYIQHKIGNTTYYFYSPKIDKQQAFTSAVSEIVQRDFSNVTEYEKEHEDIPDYSTDNPVFDSRGKFTKP